MLFAAALTVFLPLPGPPEKAAVLGPSAANVLAQEEEEEEEVEKIDSKWHGSVSAGLVVTSGNTDASTVTGSAIAVRRSEKDRTTFEASYTLSDNEVEVDDGMGGTTTEEELSQRSTMFRGQYDYFFTERTFGYVNASWMDDYANDLKHRYYAGGGLGRELIQKDHLQLGVEGGLAYFNEEYKDPRPPGEPEHENGYIAGRGAYNVKWQANEEVALAQRAEIFQSLEDIEDTFVQVDTNATVSLTAAMIFQLQWLLFYDNTPAAGNDRIDNRYLVTLGWTY